MSVPARGRQVVTDMSNPLVNLPYARVVVVTNKANSMINYLPRPVRYHSPLSFLIKSNDALPKLVLPRL